jgi:hypothetical protein
VIISFTKRFTTCLRGSSDAELQAVERTCRLAGEVFGHPHRHTGVGLRRLGRAHFECRVGVNRRLVFFREGDRLIFDFAGNHDQVQGYLRGLG